MATKGRMDKCSFCGRERNDVDLLIAGIEGHICDRCAEQAHAIIMEEFKKEGTFNLSGIKVMKPQEIKDFLDLVCHRSRTKQKKFCLLQYITITNG